MLRVYCVYVLFLGCNGISEAFFIVSTLLWDLIHSFNQLLPSFSCLSILILSFIVHLPSQTYSILLLFFKQSILKQLLTEGEKYVLSISPASMYDQGLYEIVNNLGSLFARFLFQPLEEGFYLYVKQVITVILW